MTAPETMAQAVAMRLRVHDPSLAEEARIEAALALLLLYEKILDAG